MSKSWITKGIQAELDKLVPSLQAQIKKIAKDALDPKVGVAGGKASTVKQVRSEVNKQLKDPKFITKNKRLKPPKGKEVHHKNGNPRDNRRSNLAVISKTNNRRIQPKRKPRR